MSKEELPKTTKLDEGQLRITSPFGPSIAWAKIPSTIVEKINNYVD